MKNIKSLLIGLAAVCLLAGCGESSGEDNPQPGGGADIGDGAVIGQWHMVSWSTLTEADIYISFTGTGTFDLYQRLYTPGYVHLNGQYALKDRTLSGIYGDNIPWGSSYAVTLNSDKTRLTLTSAVNGDDVSVFVKAAIPDEIRNGVLSPSALQARSDEELVRFL